MTQKALLQSAGDGTAVPAGYAGEVKKISVPSITSLPAPGVNADVGSFTLGAGTWLISASIVYQMDNDVTSFEYGYIGFSTSSGNNFPDIQFDCTNSSYFGRPLGRAADNFAIGHVSIPCYYLTISTQTTIYFKILSQGHTGPAPGYRGSATAIRIA